MENKDLGVFVALKVDPSDRERLVDFCIAQGVNMETSASEFSSVTTNMHATLLAARDPKNLTPETIKEYLVEKTYEATPHHWSVFKSPITGKKGLILHLESEEIVEYHKRLTKESGLNHSFEDYKLHVSVHYDFEGEIPKELPDFKIRFTESYTKPYQYKTTQELNKDDKFKVEAQKAVLNIQRIRAKIAPSPEENKRKVYDV